MTKRTMAIVLIISALVLTSLSCIAPSLLDENRTAYPDVDPTQIADYKTAAAMVNSHPVMPTEAEALAEASTRAAPSTLPPSPAPPLPYAEASTRAAPSTPTAAMAEGVVGDGTDRLKAAIFAAIFNSAMTTASSPCR